MSSTTAYFTHGMQTEWATTKPTAVLRWVVPDTTSTDAPRLQQLWETITNDSVSHEWHDVPVAVIPTPSSRSAA